MRCAERERDRRQHSRHRPRIIYGMFIFARTSAFAVALLALCPGSRAHAQVAPVPYANSNWFLGLGNSGLDGSDEAGRNGMPSGWFMTSTRGSFNMNGLNRLGAFGNYNALSSE